MDKLENLKKLKKLLDDGVLSEKEYSEMKNEILSINGKITNHQKNTYQETQENLQKKNGNFILSFKGNWSLFDVKTKIYINNELRFTESTKNGFEVSFPITDDEIKLEMVVGGMNSTTFQIKEIELYTNYKMTLSFDKTWGKFSDKFNIIENG